MPKEWKLYGKTGWGTINGQDDKKLEVGWFVGWVEKEHVFFPFAYTVRDITVNFAQRIPRVKQLLEKTKIYETLELTYFLKHCANTR